MKQRAIVAAVLAAAVAVPIAFARFWEEAAAHWARLQAGRFP